MTEDNSRRIRDLEKRITEWNAEHRQGLEQKRSAIEDLSQTLTFSMRAAVLGSIPAFIRIICWIVATRATDPILSQLILIGVALAVYFAIVAAAARASGLAAHWWFRGSLIHERLAATLIAIAAAFVLFGWVIVIIHW